MTSLCCQAPVKVAGSTTHYYVCEKCGMPIPEDQLSVQQTCVAEIEEANKRQFIEAFWQTIR